MNTTWDQSPDGILFNQGNFRFLSYVVGSSESVMSSSVFFNFLPGLLLTDPEVGTEISVFRYSNLKRQIIQIILSFMPHGTSHHNLSSSDIVEGKLFAGCSFLLLIPRLFKRYPTLGDADAGAYGRSLLGIGVLVSANGFGGWQQVRGCELN
jgi:hypothetical protein